LARALASTIKSVASIKNDKPSLLPPRQFRHWVNVYVIKHVFVCLSSYFSVPPHQRFHVHTLAKMAFYRLDEIPKELWPDYVSLMIKVGEKKYGFPPEVSKAIVVMAVLLRIALEECYPVLIAFGEEKAKELKLLKNK